MKELALKLHCLILVLSLQESTARQMEGLAIELDTLRRSANRSQRFTSLHSQKFIFTTIEINNSAKHTHSCVNDATDKVLVFFVSKKISMRTSRKTQLNALASNAAQD